MVGKSSFRAIMRRSIFTFLQNFHQFTAAPSLLLLPFAAATLLSHPLVSSSSSYIFPIIHGRFTSIFLAAGFPPSSQLFSILNLKLSQTLLSSIFVSPFTLSFLLLSKSSVIASLQKINSNNYNNNKIITIFNRLFVTQICNSLVILSANATCFSLLVIAFNVSDLILGLSSHPRFVLLTSAIGAVVYSVVLANAYVVCNLSLILSGLLEKNNKKKKKNCCGFSSIVDACVVLMRGGGGGVALSLAVAMNMGMAAIEALFQYRVVRAYYYYYYRGDGGDVAAFDWSVVLEAVVIAYMYGVVVVLDTIVGFVFLESCELDRCREMEV